MASPAHAPGDQLPADADLYREGPPAPSRTLELAVALGGLVLMVAVLLLARDIELRREVGPGQIDARFWPTLLAWVGIVVAAWRLVVVLLRPADQRDDLEQVQRGGVRKLLLTGLVTVLFILAWGQTSIELAGFVYRIFPIAAFVLLAALVWIYGGRGWKSLLLMPLLVTALIYGLFGMLLRIPL